jgi:hypothetical protein
MEKVRMCSFTGFPITIEEMVEEFYCKGDCETCLYGIDQEADKYFEKDCE